MPIKYAVVKSEEETKPEGELTKKYEGWRDKIYKDTLGNPTIGWGFNLADPVVSSMLPQDVKSGKRSLTQEEAEPVFKKRYEQAKVDARNFVGYKRFDELDDQTKEVITDMSYNMGYPTLIKFKKFRQAIIQGDKEKAAEELKNSLWFNQTGNRAREHYERIKKGTVEPLSFDLLGADTAEVAEPTALDFETNLKQQKQQQEFAKMMPAFIQQIQEQAKADPNNWTYEQTAKFFKDKPAQSIEEEAQRNYFLEQKKQARDSIQQGIETQQRIIPEIRAATLRYKRPLTDEERARAVVDLIAREHGEEIPLRTKVERAITSPEGQAVSKTILLPYWTALEAVRGIVSAAEPSGNIKEMLIDSALKGIFEPDKIEPVSVATMKAYPNVDWKLAGVIGTLAEIGVLAPGLLALFTEATSGAVKGLSKDAQYTQALNAMKKTPQWGDTVVKIAEQKNIPVEEVDRLLSTQLWNMRHEASYFRILNSNLKRATGVDILSEAGRVSFEKTSKEMAKMPTYKLGDYELPTKKFLEYIAFVRTMKEKGIEPNSIGPMDDKRAEMHSALAEIGIQKKFGKIEQEEFEKAAQEEFKTSFKKLPPEMKSEIQAKLEDKMYEKYHDEEATLRGLIEDEVEKILTPKAGGMAHQIPPTMQKWMEKGITVTERQAPIRIINAETKIKDISGNVIDLPKGEEYTPYKLSNGKIWLHDGKNILVDAGQLQNLENKNLVLGEKQLMPEGVEVVEKGGLSVEDRANQIKSEFSKQNMHIEDHPTGEFTVIDEHDNQVSPDILEEKYPDLFKLAGEYDQLKGEFERNVPEKMPKFSQYQLPGGKNYKEILIKAPSEGELSKIEDIDRSARGGYIVKLDTGATHRFPHAKTPEEAKQFAEAQIKEGLIGKQTGYRSSHWEEPNILAHLRVNDRTTPDGKKVLFIEELQSDWAREARQIKKPSEEEIKIIQEEKGLNREEAIKRSLIQQKPSHPFLKNWQELALKQALKMAIEGNYDAIAWTTGAQQAERYDLSKQIDSIQYGKYIRERFGKEEDYFTLRVKKGNDVSIQRDLKPEELQNFIGKDLAQKIINGEGKKIKGIPNEKELSGLDLKIGGEWAINLYDRQIPNILKDLTKGKIGSVLLPTKPAGELSGKPFTYKTRQQSLKLTPEIKARLGYEQPMAGGLPVGEESKVLNTQEDTDFSRRRELLAKMPFSLLGNKAEVLSRLPEEFKKKIVEGITQVYDLFGGAKGYRIGLFPHISGPDYKLNEYSDERNNYYKNIQDPEKLKVMINTVNQLRDGLMVSIAKGFDIDPTKYDYEFLKRSLNKWLAEKISRERYQYVRDMVQKYGDDILAQAQADKFASPESSAKYYFLENTALFGLKQGPEGYSWNQGLIRTNKEKSQLKETIKRLEDVSDIMTAEHIRDKDLVLSKEDAWQLMDRLTQDIQAGTINPQTTTILVDPQYLNPTVEAGTYSVGAVDTTWAGHQKNLETHLLPLAKTGVRIIYTNNFDPNLAAWLRENNLPYNIETNIGAAALRGGRNELISFINYQIPQEYLTKRVVTPGGQKPGELFGESESFKKWLETEGKKQAAIEKRKEVLKRFKKYSGIAVETPQRTPTPVEQKVIDVLKQAKDVRNLQEAFYTQERAKRLGRMTEIGKRVIGEKGFYAEKGALKGELPKVEFESIRNKLTQDDIDSLFIAIKDSGQLDEWEKLNAREGLAKLFGQTGGTVPTYSEIKLLGKVFSDEFIRTLMGKRSLIQKAKYAFEQIINIPRSIMSSFDLSAPFRQGAFLIGRPKQYWPAFAKMFKYFGSEKAFNALQESIVQEPMYMLAKESHLSLTSMGHFLEEREERFMSNWAEKIPAIGVGVRASGRAYMGFLNKLRFDTFKDMIKKAEALGLDPQKNRDLSVAIANFINNATGRGSLGGLERSAKILNGLFFSPRLMASRLNLLNPVYYIRQDPFVRKEALKLLFAFLGLGITILGLARMAGAKVGTDPRSSDFGKIIIGNTRIDIWAGFQQYIRSISQVVSGQYVSSVTGKKIRLGEGYKPLSRWDILQKQIESKAAPVFSLAITLLRGQNYEGKKINFLSEVGQRFVPMAMQDMIDIAQNDPALLPIGGLGVFGVGLQTYRKKIRYKIEK